MYFLEVTFFHGLQVSRLNCTLLIENNKYFLTDTITGLIKFWILIIIMPHIYIALCHAQSIYTYIFNSYNTLWVKWGRYSPLYKWGNQGLGNEVICSRSHCHCGMSNDPETIPVQCFHSLSQSNLLRDHSHLVICFSVIINWELKQRLLVAYPASIFPLISKRMFIMFRYLLFSGYSSEEEWILIGLSIMIIPFLFQVTGLERAYNYFWSVSCM